MALQKQQTAPQYAKDAFLGGNAAGDIRALQTEEAEKNSKIFRERFLSKLLKEHRDEYALMKNGEVAGIFSDPSAAFDEGDKRYEKRMFSVQRITDTPLPFGRLFRVVGKPAVKK